MRKSLSIVLAVAAAFALAALLPSPAAAQDLSQVDHYKCYDVLSWDDFPQIPLKLGDQFGFTSNEVVSPRYLCNPVSKNGEPILYPEVHLVCYNIIQEQPDPVRRVLISNQFHDINMEVKDGRLLCVPSKKTELQ